MKFIIIFLGFLLGGCSSTSHTTEEQTVQQFTVSKNYAGLVDFYKQKVIDDRNDWQAQQDLADAYLKNGDLESADFYIQRVLDLSKKPTASAYFIKGQVLARNLDFTNSLVQYSKAIDMGLDSGDVYMQRGISLAQTKQYSKAIDSFNQARLRGYDDVAIKNNIAMVRIYEGDFQAAVDILLPLYEQDSSNELVNSNLKLSALKLDESQQEVYPVVDDPIKVETFDNQENASLKTEEVEVTEISAEEFFASQPVLKESTRSSARTYHLQLGSYDNMPEALEKRNELLSTDLPITIRPADLGESGTWFRLLSGEFSSYRQAKNYANQNQDTLKDHSYFIQVIR
ncbi:hypothetical protein BCT61_02745 [Vibrio breoganii]|uniref:SPOR domain-containing protein n=1 Tax=Vibrio breoganii TaxID=553239 RepID=UPI000C8522A1|nr:SPOR domain-containing protein [Vibrio breoganii]PMF77172.1 hypothetical protein BCV08_16850 [Vibrio breoganii]PML32697.1 hypothetical protein BCT78_15730 [Vibrio breoganii]PMM04332.1 hypothetical protein BCT61_02745 [Vibrio breoganii]TKG23587.1 tetratricopeptide repeat protein [Vibrio breoganii]